MSYSERCGNPLTNTAFCISLTSTRTSTDSSIESLVMDIRLFVVRNRLGHPSKLHRGSVSRVCQGVITSKLAIFTIQYIFPLKATDDGLSSLSFEKSPVSSINRPNLPNHDHFLEPTFRQHNHSARYENCYLSNSRHQPLAIYQQQACQDRPCDNPSKRCSPTHRNANHEQTSTSLETCDQTTLTGEKGNSPRDC